MSGQLFGLLVFLVWAGLLALPRNRTGRRGLAAAGVLCLLLWGVFMLKPPEEVEGSAQGMISLAAVILTVGLFAAGLRQLVPGWAGVATAAAILAAISVVPFLLI